MGRVTGFYHAGVTVRDMDAALRFYRDALGLEVEANRRLDGRDAEPVVGVEPEAIVAVMLRVPDSEVRVELFEYEGIERHSASCRPCDYGSGHLCLFVDDAEAVHRRLVELGYSSRKPVFAIPAGRHAGAKAVYTIDPDGYHVELYERPRT
jgi:lactoylglutathione lyase